MNSVAQDTIGKRSLPSMNRLFLFLCFLGVYVQVNGQSSNICALVDTGNGFAFMKANSMTGNIAQYSFIPNLAFVDGYSSNINADSSHYMFIGRINGVKRALIIDISTGNLIHQSDTVKENVRFCKRHPVRKINYALTLDQLGAVMLSTFDYYTGSVTPIDTFTTLGFGFLQFATLDWDSNQFVFQANYKSEPIQRRLFTTNIDTGGIIRDPQLLQNFQQPKYDHQTGNLYSTNFNSASFPHHRIVSLDPKTAITTAIDTFHHAANLVSNSALDSIQRNFVVQVYDSHIVHSGNYFANYNLATGQCTYVQFPIQFVREMEIIPALLQSSPKTPLSKRIEIYPNPTGGQLWIKDLISKDYPIRISINDLNGRQVLHSTLKMQKPIAVDQLPEGSYLLQAITKSGKRYSSKFTKTD